MSITEQIKPLVAKALKELYNVDVNEQELIINITKPEFEGDYTIVLFSFIKSLKKSPEQIGKDLGTYLTGQHPTIFHSFNLIKGFLNLTITNEYWINFLQTNFLAVNFGIKSPNGLKVIVEYSSPNTNKPLHLGHLRNNFLGWSVAEILKANGYEVFKTCVVNDRGIHICKSMIAWQLFGNCETPESTNIKGDHFVGDFYVKCENIIKEESAALQAKINNKDYSDFSEMDKAQIITLQEMMNALIIDNERDKEKLKKWKEDYVEIIRANTPIMKKARQMLLDWEAGKPEVIDLWKRMNKWVYEGFDITYKRIGTDFDKIYYESDTYLLGKKFVDEGLIKDVFFKKNDGSVWIDLSAEGLDEKLVLRKDGTSVYITQDLGLADEKYKDFNYNQSIYIIGDEQNYHMKVLKLILQKLEKPYADGIYHLSYGMVDLPTGRMKSREGTVVDADDLVDEMVVIAEKHTRELGKVTGFTEPELKELHDTIALGSLKFFLLRVDPKKRMVFNPEESIDFHGFTGPFVQYTHARIKSILRKEKADPAYGIRDTASETRDLELLPLERELIILLEQFPVILEQAADEHSPSVIATYIFTVAKTYNTFYTEHSVINAESPDKKQLRLQLSELTANVIAFAMRLLGIKVPERM
jgi:arginyl-tRNA synthetase